MKIETFVGLHKTLCDDARALSQRKGHDYSGEADTLKNLKLAGAAGLCTPEQGVVVRLLDKLSRLAELDKPGAEAHVADERVRDTILDIINYACLHEALRAAQGGSVAPVGGGAAVAAPCPPTDADQPTQLDEIVPTPEQIKARLRTITAERKALRKLFETAVAIHGRPESKENA